MSDPVPVEPRPDALDAPVEAWAAAQRDALEASAARARADLEAVEALRVARRLSRGEPRPSDDTEPRRRAHRSLSQYARWGPGSPLLLPVAALLSAFAVWFELLRRRPVVASRTLDAFIASFYLVGVLLAVFWWRLQVDGAEVAQYALALLGFVFWQPRYY